MDILEALKDATKLALTYKQMDLYEKLLSVREELQQIREENLRLRDEHKNLREQLEVQQTIEFDQGVYWIRNDPYSKDKADTPVCPRCWDVEKKTVRGAITVPKTGKRYLKCKNCDKLFEFDGAPNNDRSGPFIVRG